MKYIGTILLCFVLLYFVVIYPDPIPIVYWSASQNECVRIETLGVDYSCDDFKNYERYHKIWVE